MSKIWSIEFFYFLPQAGSESEDGICWSDFCEKCSLSLPDRISTEEEAVKYIMATAPKNLFFVSEAKEVSISSEV